MYSRSEEAPPRRRLQDAAELTADRLRGEAVLRAEQLRPERRERAPLGHAQARARCSAAAARSTGVRRSRAQTISGHRASAWRFHLPNAAGRCKKPRLNSPRIARTRRVQLRCVAVRRAACVQSLMPPDSAGLWFSPTAVCPLAAPAAPSKRPARPPRPSARVAGARERPPRPVCAAAEPRHAPLGVPPGAAPAEQCGAVHLHGHP